jgi:cation diffusion facilitator family transporter
MGKCLFLQKTAIISNFRIQGILLSITVLLTGIKFSAWLITGSNAIFTDALESLVNIAAGIFALYSLYLAAKPHDEDHPYGHGKIEFISATMEGSLITAAGMAILIKSIYSVLFPEPLHQLDTGIYLTALAGFVNLGLGYFALKRGKKTGSATLKAGGKHMLSDFWSSAGLIVGLLLLRITGWLWIDTATALFFGAYISFSGIKIIREAVGGIMDETDLELVRLTVNILNENRRTEWIDIHNLRIIKYGSDIHIDCHVTLPYYLSVEIGHEEAEKVHKLIDSSYGNRVESFVHIDPCLPTSCKLCAAANCAKRSEAFTGLTTWTVENVMRNRRHGL